MADSEALRAKRSRRHKAGDHSLCTRCASAQAVTGPADVRVAAIVPLADPVAELRGLAGRLASAHRVHPGDAMLARELRLALVALAELERGGERDADLDELDAALVT